MNGLEKRKAYRNPAILAAAKDSDCLIDSPSCQGRHDTVVACHSDLSEDGKGMRQKADDFCVAFGCQDCHEYLSHTNTLGRHATHESTYWYFHRGMKRTLRLLLDEGVLK